MKKAINAWSIPDAVSFEDLFSSIATAGFAGIELNLDKTGASAHSLTMDAGQAVFDRINRLAEQYRLPVCSISTSLYGTFSLGSSQASVREQGQQLLRRQLACAAALGADGILVVPGGVGPDVSLAQASENAVESIMALKPEIEQARIKVGLENVWNGFFLSPRDLRDFIDRLGSPWIGAYFDVGNVAVNSYPEHWIEILGQRILKIHVKDFKRSPSWYQGHFVNLLEGDINWQCVIQALTVAGYDDYLTAELSPIPQNPEYLYRMTSEALSFIIGQASIQQTRRNP